MERKKWSALAILGIVVLVTSVLFGANCPEEGSLYAAALLSLSLVLEFVVLRVDDSDSTGLARQLARVEVVKISLGALYWWIANQEKVAGPLAFIGEGMAWFAFFCAVVVVWTTFRVTSAAMAEDHEDPYWKYVSRLSSNMLQALCCMLLAFLHIAYFMTFALALDDKATNGRAVHRTSSFITPSANEEAPPAIVADDTSNQSTCGAPHRDRVRKLFFETGKSDHNFEEELVSKVEPQVLRTKICGSDQNGREAFLWTVFKKQRKDATPEEVVQIRAAAWNLREKYELRELLKQMKSENRFEFRLQIQGHASNELPSDPRNFNNVDRSLTRMQYVQRMLLGMAIEAKMHLPLVDPGASGNDNFFLETDNSRWSDVELNRKLSVEVWLRPIPIEAGSEPGPPRALTLLDYTYFMIYTITTTGYGDLVPSSPFSRFLASMANLFELFFLVIIFNAILALRSQVTENDPEKKSSEATPEAAGSAAPSP